MGVAIVQIFCKLVQASAVFHLSIYLIVCLLMFILGSISLLNFLPVATLLRQLDSQNQAKTTFAWSNFKRRFYLFELLGNCRDIIINS